MLSSYNHRINCFSILLLIVLLGQEVHAQSDIDKKVLADLEEIWKIKDTTQRRIRSIQLLEFSEKSNSPRGKAYAYSFLARLDLKAANLKSAIKNASRGLREYKNGKLDPDKQKIFLLATMSQALEELGTYTDAIKRQYEVISLREKLEPDEKVLYYDYVRMGAMFDQIEVFDSSLVYYRRCTKLANKLKDPNLLIHSHNNLGFGFSQLKEIDSALAHYELAQQYFLELEHPRDEDKLLNAIAKGNMAELLPDSDPRKRKFFESKIQTSANFGEFANAVAASLSYSKMLLELRELEKCRSVLIRAEEYCVKREIPFDLKIALYDRFVQLYAKMGKIDLSLEYQQRLMKEYEQVAGKKRIDENISQIASYELSQLEDELEIERIEGNKKEAQIQVLDKEYELSQLRQRAYLIGGAILCLIAFFIIVRIRKEAKRKEKEKQLQERMLRLELEYNSERLHRSVVGLSRKREFTEELIQRINQMENLTPIQKNMIKMFLFNELDIDSNTIEQEEDIQIVGEKFITHIKANYPDLNEADIKLLSLIKMGLSNKQIAEMKNISPKSVKMSKYRLRKKMSLESGDNFKILSDL